MVVVVVVVVVVVAAARHLDREQIVDVLVELKVEDRQSENCAELRRIAP